MIVFENALVLDCYAKAVPFLANLHVPFTALISPLVLYSPPAGCGTYILIRTQLTTVGARLSAWQAGLYVPTTHRQYPQTKRLHSARNPGRSRPQSHPPHRRHCQRRRAIHLGNRQPTALLCHWRTPRHQRQPPALG